MPAARHSKLAKQPQCGVSVNATHAAAAHTAMATSVTTSQHSPRPKLYALTHSLTQTVIACMPEEPLPLPSVEGEPPCDHMLACSAVNAARSSNDAVSHSYAAPSRYLPVKAVAALHHQAEPATRAAQRKPQQPGLSWNSSKCHMYHKGHRGARGVIKALYYIAARPQHQTQTASMQPKTIYATKAEAVDDSYFQLGANFFTRCSMSTLHSKHKA